MNARIIANLVRRVAQEAGDERASKCGYDMLHAIADKREQETCDAWQSYLEEKKQNKGHTDTIRNGVWVPAIPL